MPLSGVAMISEKTVADSSSRFTGSASLASNGVKASNTKKLRMLPPSHLPVWEFSTPRPAWDRSASFYKPDQLRCTGERDNGPFHRRAAASLAPPREVHLKLLELLAVRKPLRIGATS